ncbi:MAG: hypothetical protein KME29_13105 [Calothrix sp. FI2-JRJ7]|jgi:hypothetical protein|nr:hypothetical protein [Calothrix sp. FI2-JRJ7]
MIVLELIVKKLIDKLLKLVLVKDFREEALCEIWEGHYRLIANKKPLVIRLFILLWRALLIVWASVQISLDTTSIATEESEEPLAELTSLNGQTSPILPEIVEEQTISKLTTSSMFRLCSNYRENQARQRKYKYICQLQVIQSERYEPSRLLIISYI